MLFTSEVPQIFAFRQIFQKIGGELGLVWLSSFFKANSVDVNSKSMPVRAQTVPLLVKFQLQQGSWIDSLPNSRTDLKECSQKLQMHIISYHLSLCTPFHALSMIWQTVWYDDHHIWWKDEGLADSFDLLWWKVFQTVLRIQIFTLSDTTVTSNTLQ